MKLPVGEVLRETYEGVFLHARVMVGLIWYALLAYFVLIALEEVYPDYGISILTWLILPMISVPLHRYIIEGERNAGWHGRYLWYLLATIVSSLPGIFLIIGAAFSLPFLGDAITFVGAGVFLLFCWATFYVLVRLSLLLPLTAVRGGIFIKDAWQIAEGNCWRLFLAIVGATLPIPLISLLIAAPVYAFLSTAGGEGILLLLFLVVLYMVNFLFVTLLSIAVLAVSYRRLAKRSGA
ncbi:MAG: hypothetical protein V6Z81_02725 [Parvularculales bacterium]